MKSVSIIGKLPTPNLKRHRLLVFVITAICLAQLSFGQVYGTASHTVTVTVQAITVIQVSVGSLSLNITGATAVAGQDMMSVTDQSSSLLWGINSSLKKITVNSNLVAPTFTLKVLAVSPTQGTAAPEVTLSSTATDFLINLGRTSGSSLLRYTGIALASQGTGTDAHTITFTIVTQ